MMTCCLDDISCILRAHILGEIYMQYIPGTYARVRVRSVTHSQGDVSGVCAHCCLPILRVRSAMSESNAPSPAATSEPHLQQSPSTSSSAATHLHAIYSRVEGVVSSFMRLVYRVVRTGQHRSPSTEPVLYYQCGTGPNHEQVPM